MHPSSLTRLMLVIVALVALLPTSHARAAQSSAIPSAPVLSLSQSVSAEPTLGGGVTYVIQVRNTASTPVIGRGYNLSMSDSIPAGLRVVSADPSPSLIAAQADGSTLVNWDNIADLEAGESLSLTLSASLDASLGIGATFSTTANAAVNTMPDNSGAWVRATHSLAARPQAIDLEAAVEQSTSGHQASGAGEMSSAPGVRAGADWPYRYRLTLRNNRVGNTAMVTVTATLPPGAVYLGAPSISPNPTSAATSPTLALQSDGSLTLRWGIGTLTPAQYDAPIVISFDAAVPYSYRTTADISAAAGPFAGPMHGAPIPEDTLINLTYEASGVYAGLATADGTQSTPADDAPVTITADYMTVHKSAQPDTVGIGTSVNFQLSVYIAEYYAATNVVLTDVLPDGMSYVEGSASVPPHDVQANTPSAGITTLIWALDPATTGAGATAQVSFTAKVDPVYDAAPYTGQPVVSSDRLTNSVILNGTWTDLSNPSRAGASSPDQSAASVTTRMPTFTKEVWRTDLNAWSNTAKGFTGDTLRFRLSYASATDVDARAIIIRDFLPRGMHYVAGSASHTTAGTFANSGDCTSAPTLPTVGALGGLEYLEWRLCNAARGATWQATIDARLGDIPDVQPGWLVANFGKLTGQGTRATVYSLRGSTDVAYVAPDLTLTKSANPATNLVGGSQVNFTISVTNNGAATAYNLAVSDTVPKDLLISASGGSATPTPSSYTTTSGNPASGQGGTLTWATVPSLAPGATQSFSYSATVPAGLAAGAQMSNLASVAYNSRADSLGHQWAATTSTGNLNTNSTTVYLRGVTLTLSASPTSAKPGDTVAWTITGSVPTGVVAYWPVIQANSLPQGFAYLRTTSITGATLDGTAGHHLQNPLSDGQRELRWFLNTLDNSAGTAAATFTIRFDTLFTGYKPGSPTTQYYTNNAVRNSASASVYVGWYDSAAGYQTTGAAFDGLDTSKTTRRSPRAQATVTINQPYLALSASANKAVVGASESLTMRLQVQNQGYSPAYDLTLEQLLPAGLSFVATQSSQVSLPTGWTGPAPITSDTSVAGATTAHYGLDVLPNGAAWVVLLSVRADAGIAADLKMSSAASVPVYTSQPGIPGDVDNDGRADERTYSGPTATVALATPESALRKEVKLSDGEFTHGGTLSYTLTVPTTPINATLYNVTLSDPISARLTVTGVSAGTVNAGSVSVPLGTIPPGQQRSVTVSAQLPAASPARDGEAVPNQANYTTSNISARLSNPVANNIMDPALTITAAADRAEVHVGDLVNYLVTIANVGSGRAESMTLAAILPSNSNFVAGSAHVDGAPLADLTGAPWDLPTLPGGASLNISFTAHINSAEAGASYPATFTAAGRDIRAQPIPANNSARVVADDDPDDQAIAAVYGPLVWTTDRSIVAFEDLKKYNWSDWDYNDFLARITIKRGALASGDLAAVEIHYESLARGAGFLNHVFRHQLPLTGDGWYTLSVTNPLGTQVRAERAGFRVGDPTVTIFSRTREALPQPTATMEQTNTRPNQQGVIAGQQATLTVVLSDPSANPLDGLRPLPWDPYLHVVETGQDIHLVQPGHLDNTQTVTSRFDSTAPLIGYDLPLAHVFPEGWRWLQEFAGIWRGYPAYVQYIQSGGVQSSGWSDLANATVAWLWGGAIPAPSLMTINASETAPASRYFAPPIAADITGDGNPEVIIGNLLANRVEVYDTDMHPLSGWPQTVGGGIRAAAAVADLDGDGKPEVIVGAADGKLYAWHADGSALTGWPVSVGVEVGTTYRILATPAVGDLDGDGKPEVVVPLADGRLYAFNADGTPRPGWPVSIGELHDTYDSQILNSSPRIADLDGNGSPEIIVGSTNGTLYAFNADGSSRWAFATGDMILSTPAIADIDTNHAGLEVVIGSGDGYVYLLDANGTQIWRRSTGWTVRSSPLTADVDGDGNLEILVGSDDHKLWIWHHDGSRLAGWPQTTNAEIFGAPAVGDIDGDGYPEILAGSDDAHVYAWHRDGTLVAGWPQAVTYSVKGAPALANLDADPALEVVAADMNGVLDVWGRTEHVFLPLIGR